MQIIDRVFILSGGASGLGLATARNLYSHGAYIAILDLDPDSGEAACKDLGVDRSRFFETDVSETESVTAAVSAVIKWVKETGKPIGGVISAAGVGNPGKVSRCFVLPIVEDSRILCCPELRRRQLDN